MARKVFISVLGTSFYNPCVYGRGDFRSHETRFIQAATLEFLGAKDWNKEDLVLIAMTEKTRSANWHLNPPERKDSKDNLHDYLGLQQVLAEMQLSCEVRPLDIPDGKDENEMWEIFSRIFKEIKDEDELYLELTHGFRYLPMLLLVLCNYAKFLKNVSIAHISYGNFEAKNPETKITPIVDLLPLAALQDWTYAAADYLQNGYAKSLQKLGPENSFIDKLYLLTKERQTCRGLSIWEKTTVNDFLKAEDETTNNLIKGLFEKIREEEQSLQSSYSNSCFAAAHWCVSNGLYQQAITLLQEGIVSAVCEEYNTTYAAEKPLRIENDKRRDLVNKAFYTKDLDRLKWKVEAEDIPTIEKLHLCSMLQDKELITIFKELSDIRNDYNHAGFRETPLDSQKIIDKVKENIEKTGSGYQHNAGMIKQKVFINVTNHPSSAWNKIQKTAAGVYGEIHDITFPNISPDGSAEEIETQVGRCLEKIRRRSKGKDATVHIMGEMTFTYRLVSRLKAMGIRCVASTTERIAEEKDGVKTSQFKFVRFREY